MPKKKQTKNPIEEEKLAQAEAEGLSAEQDEATLAVENLDEEAEKALIAEVSAGNDQALPAEVAALHTDNETAKELNATKSSSKKAAKKDQKDVEKKSARSASYLKAKEQVEKGKVYQLDEAIELIKKLSVVKFDATVELHLRLSQKKSKGSTESSKGTFHLSHGTGKDKKIVVLDEAKIEEIAKTKKIDFDVALSSPELMPKVARIAKILGPKGKMPDPKSGTVTTDSKKTIEEINSGRVEYRIDSSNNIHQPIGRVSWDETKLKENIQAVLGSLPKGRLLNVYLAATMTPSVEIDFSFLK